MSLVLDASAAAGWLMPDEAIPVAITEAVQGAGPLRAPWLFWIELRNILIVGERRGRLPAGAADAFLEAVDGLGIWLSTQTPSARVLELARRRRLSAYDALYLELALRLALPLATLDAASAKPPGRRACASWRDWSVIDPAHACRQFSTRGCGPEPPSPEAVAA